MEGEKLTICCMCGRIRIAGGAFVEPSEVDEIRIASELVSHGLCQVCAESSIKDDKLIAAINKSNRKSEAQKNCPFVEWRSRVSIGDSKPPFESAWCLYDMESCTDRKDCPTGRW